MKVTFKQLSFLNRHFDKGGKKFILTIDFPTSNLDLQNYVPHIREFY